MNVFILNPEGRSLMAGITEETVIHEAPCWSIHKIEGHPGEFLNEAITWDAEPFFLTLLAGERMESGFQSELQSCLDELAFHHAGLCLSGDTAIRPGDDRHAASRGPVVWRKAAVLDAGGFAARDWLPFGGYVLYEMMHRLSADWSWREFPAARLRSQPISYSPSWRKEKDQWLRIAPLLKRDNSPVSPVEQDPIFSIVICTYNSADFLPWSIRSVFEQSFSSWELIIVDDGSGDATAEKLEQFLENPRVRLLRSEHNQGKSCCLNQAAAAARGSWLLELDADDWLAFDCLQSLAASIADADGISVLYANHDEWLMRSNQELLFRRTVSSMSELDEKRLLDEAVPIAPRLYRLTALREIGGWWEEGIFDGRLYEDFQMLSRMSRSFSARHVPDVLYHRRLRHSSITRSNQDNYAQWRHWFRSAMEECGQNRYLESAHEPAPTPGSRCSEPPE